MKIKCKICERVFSEQYVDQLGPKKLMELHTISHEREIFGYMVNVTRTVAVRGNNIGANIINMAQAAIKDRETILYDNIFECIE